MDAASSIANMINSYHFAEGEQLNIVGHSHGGNVANLVSGMIDHKIDNSLNYNTPVLNDYQPKRENINNLMTVNSKDDYLVQRFGGNQISGVGILGGLIGGVALAPFGLAPVGAVVGFMVGNKIGGGEFGLAGKSMQGANNIDISNKTSIFHPLKAHSDGWNNSQIFNDRVKSNIK